MQHEQLKQLKLQLKRLQGCLTLGQGQDEVGGVAGASTRETEEIILQLFASLRREKK